MVWMGQKFKAPRKADKKAWSDVRKLAHEWEQWRQRRRFIKNEELRKK
jgi:hypothetical protein